jgi:hypothetical protein
MTFIAHYASLKSCEGGHKLASSPGFTPLQVAPPGGRGVRGAIQADPALTSGHRTRPMQHLSASLGALHIIGVDQADRYYGLGMAWRLSWL